MNNTVETTQNGDFKVVPTMSEAAKKFFASPSKLSKERRFKGSIHSNTHMTACTNQSNGIGGLHD